jgi:hypothetical protein
MPIFLSDAILTVRVYRQILIGHPGVKVGIRVVIGLDTDEQRSAVMY